VPVVPVVAVRVDADEAVGVLAAAGGVADRHLLLGPVGGRGRCSDQGECEDATDRN
jgi:hypothetical protein